jgi:hypothetical protein
MACCSAQYHYLGFTTKVGRSISYLAVDRYGRPVGCLLFGACAWKTAARDHFIEWNNSQRCADPAHPRRIYAKEKFTPEDVRSNDSAWQKDYFFIGDKWRPVRFKQISSVLWQGTGLLSLSFQVIRATDPELAVQMVGDAHPTRYAPANGSAMACA